MDGKTIWDPLRRKEVALTPEERVRQWFINILKTYMQVPLHMMRSEVSFNLGGKAFRADILVYDRKASPVAIIECKRPEVEIDNSVLDQTIRYNMVLNVRYIIITNGSRTFISRKKEDGSGYAFIEGIPSYEDMLK